MCFFGGVPLLGCFKGNQEEHHFGRSLKTHAFVGLTCVVHPCVLIVCLGSTLKHTYIYIYIYTYFFPFEVH